MIKRSRAKQAFLAQLTVPGVTGVYLPDGALFNTLLGEQTRISEYLIGLLEPAG